MQKQQKETVITVLDENTFRGGWLIRFIHQDTIRCLFEAPYVEKSFPMQISCTMFLESATVKSKHQQAIFTNVELCNGKLYFEKLHIRTMQKHSPAEFYNVTKDSFLYEGFWGIRDIRTFKLSLSEEFDMRDMIRNLQLVTSQLNIILRLEQEFDSDKILEYLLDVLNISLEDIKSLTLSNFLEIRSGNIIYSTK